MKRTELAKKTLAELRSMAKARGLRGYSGFRKPQLIEKLVASERSDGRKRGTPASGVTKSVADKRETPARRKRTRGSVKRATSSGKKSAPGKLKTSGSQDMESVAGRGLSPRTRRASPHPTLPTP